MRPVDDQRGPRRERTRSVPLEDATDEELVNDFQQTRSHLAVDALLRRHQGLVLSVARHYFVPGGDAEDVRQQAMIGFWKAVRDYSSDAGAAFASFARTCMQRQVITAVKAANRMKHAPLTAADRLPAHDADTDGDGRTSPIVPTAGHEDSAIRRMEMDRAGGMPFGLSEIEGLIEQHGHDAIHEVLRAHFAGKKRRSPSSDPDRLTQNEAHVLVGLLSGKRYQEIADEMGKSAKFVDNAVQRLRAKLRHLLEG